MDPYLFRSGSGSGTVGMEGGFYTFEERDMSQDPVPYM
jgi:hypothetical protein